MSTEPTHKWWQYRIGLGEYLAIVVLAAFCGYISSPDTKVRVAFSLVAAVAFWVTAKLHNRKRNIEAVPQKSRSAG
jgi:hypothetical protein